MKKPVKKGRVGKTEDGKLVLINAEGKIFGADKTLLAIWQICDGTVGYEELIRMISENVRVNEETVKNEIERITGEMREAGLMEFVE